MNASDPEWEFWSKEPFKPSCRGYWCHWRLGSSEEPGSSLWCASLLDPVRDRLSAGFRLLDWGCGDGRLMDFISRRFRDFSYMGVEKSGKWGRFCVGRGEKFFRKDSRASFGLTETPFEAEAVRAAEVVVMGSVMTHLVPSDAAALLWRVSPVLVRGGALVTSLIVGQAHFRDMSPSYGHGDCHALVPYSIKAFDGICRDAGARWEEAGNFLTRSGRLHRIMLVSAR